jgi:hypothetical protein
LTATVNDSREARQDERRACRARSVSTIQVNESIVGAHDVSRTGRGPAYSTALAEHGDSNIAYVLDPSGAAGSPDSAIAGGFSNDLAEVLFTHGNASADTANLLYDIVSLFGNFSGSF